MNINSIKKAVVTAIVVAATTTASRADIQLNANNFNNNTALGIIYDIGGLTPLGAGGFVQVFAGPAGATFAQLVAVGNAIALLSGPSAGYINPAQVVSLTSSTLFGGQSGVYQLRAWKGGTAYGVGNTANGVSAITTITFGGTPQGGGPGAFVPDTNLHPSFALTAVPEPSVLALGVIGAAGLLLRRRK
jgi:hypothetical protein